MDTQQVEMKPINPEIYEAAQMLCMGMVETTPDVEKLFAMRETLMAAIKDKVAWETYRDIEDLYMAFVNEYGTEMFRLGLAIGRDPSLLFDLPAGE